MTPSDIAPSVLTPEPSRAAVDSKKVGVWVALAMAAVVAVGAGAWFAFLSPHDSTVRITADTSAAVPGKPVIVAGSVTPTAAHRVIELAVATSPEGPFTPAGTAATDAAGRFQTTWTPAQAGKAWVKATAVQLGRDQEAQSVPVALTVRAPATLTLKLSATAIRTTGVATVTATVAPAGAEVTLETSPNGSTWTPVTSTPGKNGTATAKLTGLTGGTWHIRGTAAQTETATAATSKEATLLVEDYKAAGAKYLAIVAKSNKQVEKLNTLLDADSSLAEVKKQAAALSAAYSQAAKEMRAYKGWPRAVAPVIADLAQASVIDADHFHLLSQVRTLDEWNQESEATYDQARAGGDVAARARDLLGLPKRDLYP